MIIQILVDNQSSWIMPYANELVQKLLSLGHETRLLHHGDEVRKGDVLCLLACEKIFRNLHLNRHNLVVHESDLPKGKGWSPVTWQVLEGKTEIPVTLFEATPSVDAGPVYSKSFILLKGHELLPEIKHKQGIATQELILNFVNDFPDNKATEQQGESTYYEKRGPAHSELDMTKSIEEQFDLLRVCDNDRYPAFFVKDGIKYILKIEKA